MDILGFNSFVRDIFREKDSFIPLHVPRFQGKEKDYVLNSIESTMVSSVGSFVNDFEDHIASYTKSKGSVAVANGTSGLQIALKLAGVMPNDEVITQALTFVATANAINYNHANPVFIDVDLDTMGMSPEALERFLQANTELRADGTYNRETGRKIGACMPMHTFGFLTRIDDIVLICEKYNIPVVEDAAEALGSIGLNSRMAGTFGNLGVYSFNGNKVITAGGGGSIVSNSSELLAKGKHLTTTAKKPHAWEYFHDEVGYNFRMPNINAALAFAQLEKIEDYIKSKQDLFGLYQNQLLEFGLKVKEIPSTTVRWNYWLQAVELNNLEERNLFLSETNSKGIMTRPIWQLMYRLPMYSSAQRDDQKNAEYLEERIVNIPSSAR